MRSNQLSNAVGLLKEEMRQLDSLIMKAADKTQVPAGGALAVDRDSFSKYVTDTLRDLDNVTVHEEEITEIPEDGITVIATGPLTSDAFKPKKFKKQKQNIKLPKNHYQTVTTKVPPILRLAFK